jgi:hypothetical protein
MIEYVTTSGRGAVRSTQGLAPLPVFVSSPRMYSWGALVLFLLLFLWVRYLGAS